LDLKATYISAREGFPMKMRVASLSLLTILFLLLPVATASAGQILYENGPYDDDTDAWLINQGYIVSDTFTLPSNSIVGGFDLVVWEFPGDTVLSVDWSITSQANGGTLYGMGTANVASTFLYVNAFGFDVYQLGAAIPGVDLNAGTDWLNLQNAVLPSGDPVYWDENSGEGCHSLGCPSLAYDSGVGTIPSETFTIEGNRSGTTPEPSSLILLGSAIVGLAGVLRRRG
jgi:hypothetical protein